MKQLTKTQSFARKCMPVFGQLTLSLIIGFLFILAFSHDNRQVSKAQTISEIGLNQWPSWSSTDRLISTKVAWGDVDGDGDLDLAVAGWNTPVRVYRNINGVLQQMASWRSDVSGTYWSLAWGDMNGDGYLDLATSIQANPSENNVYLNVNGSLQPTATWRSNDNSVAHSLAWGDVDGDSDLDLAAGNRGQPNVVYFNDGGILTTANKWTSAEIDNTTSVAWGDMNGDGYLDLAAGNDGQPSKVYLNLAGQLQTTATWRSLASNSTLSIDWGDVDKDGYLDLAVGNYGQSNEVYLNKNGMLEQTAIWNSTDTDPIFHNNNTFSVAWGDADNDGDLDLAVGTERQANKVYINNAGVLENTPSWRTSGAGSRSVAWGDMDNDGDLELATGKNGENVVIYLNQATLQRTSSLLAHNGTVTWGVAWGDMDNDGDLDLAQGNATDVVVYPNSKGVLARARSTTLQSGNHIRSVAWGDMNNDGYLDLAVGENLRSDPLRSGAPNHVYLNIDGRLQITPTWESIDIDNTGTVAWGDMNGDGYLDLATGNYTASNKVYLNIGGTLQPTATWLARDADFTVSVAWGDVDNDGDLDLAAGNDGSPNKIYLNEAGVLQSSADWNSSDINSTISVAWGDMNGDGYLDLATGNAGSPNKVYINIAGRLQPTATWTSNDGDATYSIVWGDVDGDGDLDLAAGNRGQPDRLYLNEGGMLQRTGSWGSAESDGTNSIALGDIDGNGSLDLTSGQSIYWGIRPVQPPYARPVALGLYLARDITTTLAPATYFTTGDVQPSGVVSIPFNLFHPTGEPMREIRVYYSLDGSFSGDRNQWRVAQPVSGTQTSNLTTSPYPTPTITNTHIFQWDVFATGFFGQSDNVVLRIEALPNLKPITNGVPGPFQIPYVTAQTYPFRVRGMRIQVINEANQPVTGAKVYRIPARQNSIGQSIGNGSTVFQTDWQGYLKGRGTLSEGDQLLALAPQPLPITTTMKWAAGLTDTIHLYHTSGTVTETGVTTLISNTQSVTVTKGGVQVLQVSPKNPLLLFDLRVALEWDASTDPNEVYLSQLRSDLQKTAEFLYDFTNGQATLGTITVTQNAEDWLFADVVVKASNRLRPLAVQGGVVVTDTPDISSTLNITYTPGQVIMGATWNRYGTAGQNLGYDWPLALAHELSHYLFFLDDTYLGKTKQGLLITVDTCVGSVMGDMYNPSGENTEFIANEQDWKNGCQKTLAHELQRTEWATIRQRYPVLTDTQPLAGPSRMSFDFTQIKILTPTTPTATLADPILFLDYDDRSKVSSGATRAYLIRENQLLFDLGTPVGGQNRLLAHGAREGDRLCVVDPQQKAAGCELISRTDERLELRDNPNWQPNIEIRPVNTSTVNIKVQMISYTVSGQLTMRLFPDLFYATQPIALIKQGDFYSATVALTYTLNTSEVVPLPIVGGYLELWDHVAITGELTANHTIMAFHIGGNWGNSPYIRAGGPYIRAGGPYIRAGGPYIRAGGPYIRAGGTSYRNGYAPMSSTDGSFIQVMTDTQALKEGDLYTIQDVAVYPALPTNTMPVGQVYQVITSTSVKTLSGSISFQYVGSDALALGLVEADEQALQIYHCPDRATACEGLDTIIDTKYNLASALSRGAGFYALLARIRAPQLEPSVVYTIPVEASGNVSIIVRGQNFDTDTKLLVKDCTGVSHIISATLVSGNVIGADLPLYSTGTYTVHVLKDHRVSEEFTELQIGDPTKDECNP
jgi:hypothetical protein